MFIGRQTKIGLRRSFIFRHQTALHLASRPVLSLPSLLCFRSRLLPLHSLSRSAALFEAVGPRGGSAPRRPRQRHPRARRVPQHGRRTELLHRQRVPPPVGPRALLRGHTPAPRALKQSSGGTAPSPASAARRPPRASATNGVGKRKRSIGNQGFAPLPCRRV